MNPVRINLNSKQQLNEYCNKNVAKSKFWLGFWPDNKSSFHSVYCCPYIYCFKERDFIIRKTKVRNHRRVAQISWEAISVKNPYLVGKGVVMVVSASTPPKGVG